MPINYHYPTDSKNIDLENIKEHLRNIVKIILESPKYLISKIKSEKHDLNYEETLELKEINKNINQLYQIMDEIAILLKESPLFNDEYFDFCEIEDMTKYTLNREYSLIQDSDLEFILKLVKNFSELIDYKIDLIENDDFDEKSFEIKYNSYLTNFNNSQTYFYKNICDESLDDDLFIKYTNIIRG